MRIVLDTNIFIYCLRGRMPFTRLVPWVKHKHILLTSEHLESELSIVLERLACNSAFRHREDQQEVVQQEVIALLADAEMIRDVPSTRTPCRDKGDDFLLNLAVAGQADWLVSEDKDLYTMSRYQGVRITTARDFARRYRGLTA